MPSPPVCLAIARVSFSSALPPVFNVRIISATTSPQRNELPRRFVTQTLPKLLNVLQILVGPALAELGAIRRATPPPLEELASFRKCGGASVRMTVGSCRTSLVPPSDRRRQSNTKPGEGSRLCVLSCPGSVASALLCWCFPLLWFAALLAGILVEDLQHGGGETARQTAPPNAWLKQIRRPPATAERRGATSTPAWMLPSACGLIFVAAGDNFISAVQAAPGPAGRVEPTCVCQTASEPLCSRYCGSAAI